MKALVQRKFGSPDALEFLDVDVPAVPDDGVLVRVRAACVNAADWHQVRGEPLIARAMMGGLRPKQGVVGGDAAGVVEAIGKDVTELQPGDEVYGSAQGAFAEYVSGRQFVRKPKNVTFEQAAAVPVAGSTALQAVRDHAHVHAGQRVLVTGAGGGVGTFAVQVACAFGAEVTAVTSTGKVDLVRSIGATRVIDYTREDLSAGAQRYDAIIDIGANYSIPALRRVLAPGGTLVLVGASKGRVVGPFKRILAAAIRARVLRQRIVFFVARISSADLAALAQLIEAGKITPVIDRTYPLGETAQALRYVETGQARGKVVIAV